MFCFSLRRLASAAWFAAACGGLLFEPARFANLTNITYDYVIIGGGTAGLTVANRLSEDPSVTVLVLEAGTLDNSRNLRDPSGFLPIPGLIGSNAWHSYQWNLTTVPQRHLNNQSIQYTQGRAIGGSSILNGLCWTRGSAADYDAWEALGNNGWGWKDLLPYFKKSENFTPDSNRFDSERFGILPDPAAHGRSGPINVAYPRYFYNQSENILQGFSQLGVDIVSDPNTGVGTGAMIVPSSIHPRNQTRWDAREAYYEQISRRPNIHIATEQRATRLLLGPTNGFALQRQITGVEFATDSESSTRIVSCSKEVVLSSGAIFSPTLLQVSGIGPPHVLEELGIQVQIDSAGVGHNFQDHPLAHVDYYFANSTLFRSTDIQGSTYDRVSQMYLNNRTGPWTAPLVNTVAFPALRWVTNDWQNIISNIAPETANFTPDIPQPVRQGYMAQQFLIKNLLSRTDVGAFEILATSWGRLSVATQKPLSRGTVRPSSRSIFDKPLIDPRYCSNIMDCEIMVLALQMNINLTHTNAVKELLPVPEPGFNTTDAKALMDKLIPRVNTEYHPCGTAVMMPRELGGVVDPELRVYGTSNLRVVDASIIPMIPSAHLQAVVYAIAEKAADMIKSNTSGLPYSLPSRC